MKKLLFAFLITGLLLCLCCLASADDSLSFRYLEDGTVELLSYSTDGTEVIVPAELGGQPVTAIGEQCFYYAGSDLASVQLPASVTVIGSSAFSGCENLSEIKLPAGLKSIGPSAFWGCSGLTALVIPDKVTEIGESAFAASGLTEIILPAGVTAVGADAFAACEALTAVTVKSPLTECGEGVFRDCTALASVTIGEGVTALGNSMFANCEQLTEVHLPKSLESIGDSAFSDCSALAEITLPANVKSIGAAAFTEDAALAQIALPDSLETIGSNAFNSCSALTGIVIPGKTVSIGDSAFYSCGSLLKITIPASVTEIGEDAFTTWNDNTWLVVDRDSPAAAYCAGAELRYRFSDGAPRLSYFGEFETISGIIAAANNAVLAGEDPAVIYQELLAEAKEYDMSPWVEYQLENMAALGSAGYEKMAAMNEEGSRNLFSDYDSSYRSSGNENGLEVYGVAFPEGEDPEPLKAMIADKGAQYCFEPILWAESEFASVCGADFSRFKPSRPRPGYICVVAKKGAENDPGVVWNPGDDGVVLSLAENAVSRLIGEFYAQAEESMPVFTGNPNLASIFLVVDVRYPFHANYGSGEDLIRGYNCQATITAVNAADHKTIAELTATTELGDTIYRWDDETQTSAADMPELTDMEEFSSAFTAPVLQAIRLQDCEIYAGRVLTENNLGTVLNAILLKQTVGRKDVWQNAVYSAGARDFSLAEETHDSVTFSLRRFDPKTESLGAFAEAENPSSWLRSALSNSAEYSLTLTLPVESGRLTAEAMASLDSEVAAAAAHAQAEYTGADLSAALTWWLFPAVTDAEEGPENAAALLEPSDSFRSAVRLTVAEEEEDPEGLTDPQQAIVLWSVRNLKADFSGGPCALVYSGTGADPAFITETKDAFLEEMVFQTADQRPEADQVENELYLRLAEKALQFHTDPKGGAAFALTVNPDDLTEYRLPVEYRQYLSGFRFAEAYDALNDMYTRLPEEAAIPFPETGLLSGGQSGTVVNFVVPKTSGNTYIQMRSDDTDEIMASAFVHSGSKTRMRVPSGMYRVLYCSGPWWYGETVLFGDFGSYNQSEAMEVLDTRYIHTLTLESNPNGSIGIYGASPDDFR